MKTQHNLRKGDRLIVSIESIAAGGEGVAKVDGMPIFVNRVAPGDRVEIELYDVRKSFAFGRTINVVDFSSTRAEPPCKLFKICGGCDWQHIAYEHQVEQKTDLVRQAIKHIGGLDDSIVRLAISAPDPLFYRNKVQYPVTSPRNSSRILAGYFKEGSHELVNIKHCPIQPEPLDRLLESAKDALEQNFLPAYREQDHSGVIRHIAARYSFAFREVLLTFVVNEKAPGSQQTLERLRRAGTEIMSQVPEVSGVCVNFNAERGNRIMGPSWTRLVGTDRLKERLQSDSQRALPLHRQGITFQLTPLSFFQVNTAQSIRLLELVFEAVQDHCKGEPGLIIDAYGGVGTIALWLSPYARKLVCIEEVDGAIEDGIAIAATNNIVNVEFKQGKVEDVLPQLAQQEKIDVVVVDPPRKGLSPSVIDTIVSSETPLVIYVSCNPATLARDLKLLAERGYRTISIQPLDMFPQTHHVESICVVTRGHID